MSKEKLKEDVSSLIKSSNVKSFGDLGKLLAEKFLKEQSKTKNTEQKKKN